MPQPLNYYGPEKQPRLPNREPPSFLGLLGLFLAVASFPCCYSIAYVFTASQSAGVLFAGIMQMAALTLSAISFRTTAGKIGITLAMLSTLMSLSFFLAG